MSYTYKNSGVDIDLANATVKEISKILETKAEEGFAGIIEHPWLEDFYLCATTDGIGTKILPLLEAQDYATIANDLIAMNLNDLACAGAFPMLFLDYIAVNRLDKDICLKIISELKNQLANYRCPLVGGEIAELKTIVKEGALDISGFALGLVEKKSLLGKHNVKEGDVIVGLSSSGIHTNGFTLINKLANDNLFDIKKALTPTKIYISEILELNKKGLIKAAANITGGGLCDNIKRIIPNGLCAEIEKSALPKLEIFEELTRIISEDEAYRVFNMGCGMALIIDRNDLNEVLKITEEHDPRLIGVIKSGENSCISLR